MYDFLEIHVVLDNQFNLTVKVFYFGITVYKTFNIEKEDWTNQKDAWNYEAATINFSGLVWSGGQTYKNLKWPNSGVSPDYRIKGIRVHTPSILADLIDTERVRALNLFKLWYTIPFTFFHMLTENQSLNVKSFLLFEALGTPYACTGYLVCGRSVLNRTDLPLYMNLAMLHCNEIIYLRLIAFPRW